MNDITQGIAEQFSDGKYRLPMIGAAILAPLFEVCKADVVAWAEKQLENHRID